MWKIVIVVIIEIIKNLSSGKGSLTPNAEMKDETTDLQVGCFFYT